jgi:hypothetical protein
MKSIVFTNVNDFLKSGEFSHLEKNELKRFETIIWYEDGSIYGGLNGCAHDIDYGCGFPENLPKGAVWGK